MAQEESSADSDAIWPGFVRRAAKSIRLILIDDHPVVREGLCALLCLESDFSVVGDAGDIASGIELVRRHKPDLVICDLTMPECTGVMAIHKLRAACPEARVLVLTADGSLECMRESFAAGSVGYVRKDALRVDLLHAVRRAAGGDHAICRGVGNMVMRNWLLEPQAIPNTAEVALDPADRQILRLIALGVPTWQIAAELKKGVKAVEKQRAALLRRLNLSSTAAVARFAVGCNLLSREEVDQLVSAD